MFNFLDTFSGIGGFHLAAKIAGLPIAGSWHSDIAEYPNRVYKKNFPESVALGDITKVDGIKLQEEYNVYPWIITGGFPCQDASTASPNKPTGINGSRTSLWWHLLRLIKEIRPILFIGENVPNYKNCGLSQSLNSLAQIGYDAEWHVISASSIGAPHRRERLWIAAYPSSCGWKYGGSESMPRNKRGRASYMARHVELNCTDNRFMPWVDRQKILGGRQIQSQSIIRRVDDGLPFALDRIAACGNSIVPTIACRIFLQAMPNLLQSATKGKV